MSSLSKGDVIQVIMNRFSSMKFSEDIEGGGEEEIKIIVRNWMKYEDPGLMKRYLGTRNARPSLTKRNEEILKEITKILASPPLFVLKAKI